MSEPGASYRFKLRRDIVIEEDLSLARMELDAFISAVHNLQKIDEGLNEVFHGGELLSRPHDDSPPQPFITLTAHTRPGGQQGFAADAPLTCLPELIRCVSFIQAIYCWTPDTSEARRLLHDIENTLGPVVASRSHGGHLLIYALPHYALFELAEIVTRRARNPAETRRHLPLLLDALMGRTDDPRAIKLADDALSAQSITSHLSHDLHYYKAKFFPRMARAMLNVCARRLGEGPRRVLDPFVGSGTTLLEAALLGMDSAGLDIDPLSVLIARTKVDVLQIDSEQVAHEAALALERLRSNGQLRLFDSAREIDDADIKFPAWLLKNRRMTPEIAAQLCSEIKAVRAVVAASDPAVRDLFRVLLSDAISRRIRMRFLGTGVGRFSLTFSASPLDRLFARSLGHYANVTAACEWLRETLRLKLAASQVTAADARAIPDTSLYDIILTSPPYLPASSGRESYAKARAPSLIALGMVDTVQVDSLVDESIGSMESGGVDASLLTDEVRAVVGWLQHDDLRASKAEPTARYFLDMRQSFAEMRRALHPGGLAVIVSGRQNTFYRFATRDVLYTVRTADLLADEARRAGFEVEGWHDLPLKKSNMNARPRSLDDYYETLILLRKPVLSQTKFDS